MTNRINNKYNVSVLVIMVTGLVAGCEMASGDYPDGNFAEVIAVTALTKTISVPREECQDEIVTLTHDTKDPNRIVGTVAGAVVGGVIGNQIGSGRGRDAATVGGVVVGGYAGNQVQEGMQDRNTYQETRQNCQTVYDSREQAAGYEVTYRLNDIDRKINMDYDPGRQIAIVNGILQIDN